MKQIGLITILLLLILHVPAQANQAPVRLALIAETATVRVATDILTVQLSSNQEIHLLERDEIAKIYKEQGVSSENRDYLKLGQLLGADGIIVVSPIQQRENVFLTIRLIAVKTGVILASERYPWPIENMTQWGSGIACHLGPLVPKLLVSVNDAIPVSIMNIHSALQTEEARDLESQLSLLAIERLSRERQLFVLERRRMQLLDQENELQKADSAFWSGSYLLIGTIDPESYSEDKMTVKFRLLPPQGGVTQSFEVCCSRTNLSEAVNRLTEKTLDSLNLAQGRASWNASDEAEQFFSEAKWAYRWKLFTQAEFSSESAWALGNHTKELAALRIRAYTSDVGIWDESDIRLAIPRVPDSTKLKALIRASGLFNVNARLIFTNTAPLDADWLQLGVEIFRESAAMLDSYYRAAELRTGNEEQLLELRLLTRQILPLLETRQPTMLSKLNLIKWNQGGLWYEKPEQALPLFRGMIDNGYLATRSPRIIGWTRENRRLVPKITKQFLEEVPAMTNAESKLARLYLAVSLTPFYPSEAFHQREKELVDAIWESRELILNDPNHAEMVRQTGSVLTSQYSLDPNLLFYQGPFASLVHKLRKEYLRNLTAPDRRIFYILFPNANEDPASPAEAGELLPLIELFAQKVKWQPAVLGRQKMLQRRAGVVTHPMDTRPVVSAEAPLLARFLPWNVTGPASNSELEPKLHRLIVRNDRLWSEIYYIPKGSSRHSSDVLTSYVVADPQTGMSQEILFPKAMGSPDGVFEVFNESLFVSVQNHLQCYNIIEKTWATIPVPMEGGAQMAEIQGKLYLATQDSLLELTPETQAISIIASSRRLPPNNELDSAWSPGAKVYARADKKLGVIVNNQIFSFLPNNRVLERVAVLPVAKMDKSTPYYTQQGVQMLLAGYGIRPSLVAFWDNSTKPELLLQRVVGSEPPNPALDKFLGPCLWDWPSIYNLEAACVLAEGQNLWMLHPRCVRPFGLISQEPIVFQDNRQATLLYFERGIQQSASLPVRFEKDNQPTDPFEDRSRRDFSEVSYMPKPFAHALPQGFVIASPSLLGHWLISKSMLEERLQVIRTNRSVEALSSAKEQGKKDSSLLSPTNFANALNP